MDIQMSVLENPPPQKYYIKFMMKTNYFNYLMIVKTGGKLR